MIIVRSCYVAPIMALLVCLLQSPGHAQTNLPLDPSVSSGKLPNGLTYYIRENHKPEKRAELRLVVRAGSILEDDAQRGLAHFVEHMCFNGTKNFHKQELVNFLESVGMRFGADLNAYTSFDETVYSLQVPTDSAGVLEKALQILQDWAHDVSFDDDEIDKERGVVIEEWRGGRGAESRMRDQQLPVLYYQSQYAVRLPIGLKQVLDTFNHATLRKFYKDWYRPDLMAVVVVGDFDKHRMETLVRKRFSAIPKPKNPRKRQDFSLPSHDQTLYAIASDQEATRAGVSIYYKRPARPNASAEDYRRRLVEQLYNAMLSQRLSEIAQQPDPPFQFAYSSSSGMSPSTDAYVLSAAVDDNGIIRGMDAVLSEAERVRRFGFTQSELDRMKTEFLRSYEQAYDERGKTESGSYVQEYVSHFLRGESAPGIEVEHKMAQNFIPGITLDEVNRQAQTLMSESNRVVAVTAPKKDGLTIPSESDLRAVFASIAGKSLTAYEDNATDDPLISTPPTPGKVVSERKYEDIGVVEWKLSNGVRVLLKPTDFKNDEVIFGAFSPGGTSLVADSDFVNASTATSIASEGGLGPFDLIQLQKLLAGKVAGAYPYIGETQEGLSGSASPRDIETMFQLIYLTFTSPRYDSSAFLSFRSRMKGSLRNRNARPESAFGDTLQAVLSQHHFRRRPWTEATVDAIDPHRAFAIYQDRFADAGDFSFVFVGTIDTTAIRSLVETYLGSLPASGRVESWRDIGVVAPKGVIEKTVRKGTEPKARVQIIFTGPFEWSRANRVAMNATTDVLEIMLRETLREEKGGVYSVGVYGSPSRIPRSEYSVSIGFGCAPERVDELSRAVFQAIDSLRTIGPEASTLAKVKETARRDWELGMKENQFWMAQLQFYLNNDEPLNNVLIGPSLIEKLTAADVRAAAQRYLNVDNYIKVVLVPEAQ